MVHPMWARTPGLQRQLELSMEPLYLAIGLQMVGCRSQGLNAKDAMEI